MSDRFLLLAAFFNFLSILGAVITAVIAIFWYWY